MSNVAHEAVWCPVMRPTVQEFQKPFVQYVEEVFASHPDLPMFKVIPPPGWSPRQGKLPDMDQVSIQTPIRQNCLGSKGAYRCIYVVEPEMSVAQFKAAAEECSQETMMRRIRGSDEDGGVSQLERCFWSNITLNPPIYGADTPVSLFDASLPYGWNLRELHDLLRDRNVPEVPGVTTPMTYFGMWRSFFGWHKEDADLLSINYLHFGAPKMWYCISPAHQDKFERLAAGLFPQLHRACKAFIRHKDIMLSPSLLHAHGIPFMQAKHCEGEFIVLNAAAYHSGFNLGFNCAEAVNFATPSWLQAGKQALPCRCRKDAVHISMSLFDPACSSDDEDEGGHRCRDPALADSRGVLGGMMGFLARPPGQMGMSMALGPASTSSSAPSQPRKRGRDVSIPGLGLEDVVVGDPWALLGEDEQGTRFFDLVQRLKRPASVSGRVVVRVLKQGPDGLYRPSHKTWEEREDSLVKVRTQYLAEGLRKRPAPVEDTAQQQQPLGAGWKLLTLRSRILGTQLVQ